MSTLKVVTNPPNAAVDIVLVHGWRDGQQPWTCGSGDSSIFWAEKILPAETPGARILTFEYDTDLDRFWAIKGETRLDSISDDLFDALEDQRSETTKRPIIFVAHSIGGLVLENGLVRAIDGYNERKELANCIRRVALLGTPHRGTDKTLWAETAVNFLALSGTADAPRPEDLAEKLRKFVILGKEFPALLESRSQAPETRLELACFYEGSPTELGLDSRKIVEESAAHVPGCPHPQQLDAKHQSMGEFKSKDDPNFRRVARQLARWARELAKPSVDKPQTAYISNATFSGDNNSGFQLGQSTGNLSGFTFGGGKP